MGAVGGTGRWKATPPSRQLLHERGTLGPTGKGAGPRSSTASLRGRSQVCGGVKQGPGEGTERTLRVCARACLLRVAEDPVSNLQAHDTCAGEDEEKGVHLGVLTITTAGGPELGAPPAGGAGATLLFPSGRLAPGRTEAREV